jgi:hypothetical protein
VAFGLSVIGDIINTFEKTATANTSRAGISVLQTTLNELNGRDRILQLLDFGSVLWATGLLLGVALLIHGGGPLASGAGRSGPQGSGAGWAGSRPSGAGQARIGDAVASEGGARRLLIDLFALSSAAVAVAAVVNVIIWLSYLGDTTALGLRSVLVELGALVVAAATAAWAWTSRPKPPAVPAQAPYGAAPPPYAAAPPPTRATGGFGPPPQATGSAPPAGEPTAPRPPPPPTPPAPPPPPWGPAPGSPPAGVGPDPDTTADFRPPSAGYPPTEQG